MSGTSCPIYRQIVRQVIEAIAGGRVAAGERLPSQRELARELVVSPLTVKKAYDELERAGTIRTARGQGTFVSDGAQELSAAERIDALRPAARQLVSEATLSGVGEEELAELLREERARMTKKEDTE